MLAKICVKDYMSKHPVTLTQDMDVVDAIKRLLQHKITSAPVLDAQGYLLGLFSEKDGINVVLKCIYDQGMSGKVGDFMTKETISVDTETSIVDLAERFQKSSIRSFPVFENNKLVGVISRTDVLKALITIK